VCQLEELALGIVSRFCVSWRVVVDQTPFGLGSSVVQCELDQLDSHPDSVWIG
jgi:hypothetical protein